MIALHEERFSTVRDLLLTWWTEVRDARDELPWRSERDPWRVLVAEMMLAQTQAPRVAERYPAVIEQLSSPREAAALEPARYLELWAGLGYYRRALFLRASAIAICEHFDGVVPSALADLLTLPGVGPYTARAVLAFAFEASVGVLDTNIGRVLARAIAGRPLRAREAQELADALVPDTAAREWNLAVMDFGAIVCRSRSPLCADCPLNRAGWCRWRSDGGDDPATRSAGTSRAQARFSGSDRQGRGRLLKRALTGPITAIDLADASGWSADPERAAMIARRMVEDGLLSTRADGAFVLAGREI